MISHLCERRFEEKKYTCAFTFQQDWKHQRFCRTVYDVYTNSIFSLYSASRFLNSTCRMASVKVEACRKVWVSPPVTYPQSLSYIVMTLQEEPSCHSLDRDGELSLGMLAWTWNLAGSIFTSTIKNSSHFLLSFSTDKTFSLFFQSFSTDKTFIQFFLPLN